MPTYPALILFATLLLPAVAFLARRLRKQSDADKRALVGAVARIARENTRLIGEQHTNCENRASAVSNDCPPSHTLVRMPGLPRKPSRRPQAPRDLPPA